ncbi:GNAT family N-acetyltransferase [Nocardiopsis valliformis]|uniref:GNAT family N-acetyltransferase n=1 Tax=Nocardiopsis valliformis TaxID=239974 RepID=UPI0003448C48|nr:N-acetyltransferase [Nocardiopsis valliformis]
MSANTPEQAETSTPDPFVPQVEVPEPQRVPGLRLVRLDRTTPEVALLREVLPRQRVAPDQRRFVDEAVHTLPRADEDPERFPYAIVLNSGTLTERSAVLDACVGFGIIDRVGQLRDLVDDPADAVQLRAFYIALEHQGRGIGRAACAAPLLDLFVAAVDPRATQIVLCLNDGNELGERTYSAAGFTPTGRRYDAGEHGMQRVLSRPVQTGYHPVPQLPEPR